MNLNELRDKVHANAVEKGFWDKPLSDQHFLMLVITELSEAVEADRKGRRAQSSEFKTLLHNQEHSEVGLSEQWYEDWYPTWFGQYIKDSIEDELADAFIRLLDLAGARNFNMNRVNFANVVSKNKTFTENIYAIIKDLTYRRYSPEEQVFYCLSQVSRLADILDIPLPWHVEQKMKYNQLRERMHGKKY